MRITDVAISLTCGLLWAACAAAQPPPEADSFDIPRDPTRTIQLENGLRVVMIEDHAEPKVSVQLWYRVGASADPADKPGLTHVVLTARRLQSLARAAESFAVDSATLSDACYEICDGAKTELDRLLSDARRRMNHGELRIDRSTLRREIRRSAWREQAVDGGYRMPVGDEWDDFRMNPAAYSLPLAPSRRASADVAMRTALFGDHAYSRPPEAVDLSLRGISDDDIIEHHKRWFVTGAAVLVIYGDVDAEAMLATVRSRFGDLPWAEPPPLDRQRPPASGRALVRLIDRDTWEVAFRVPPLATPEHDALAVLRELLLNPVDGLWAREGRVSLDEWATTEAAAWRLRIQSPNAHAGRGSCSFAPPPALLGPILEHVATRQPDPVRLHRARALALTKAARDKWSFSDRAAMAGAGFALAHGADLNVQPDVAADAVRQVARAMAEQLQYAAGGASVQMAPPRDVGRIDVQIEDVPEANPMSSTMWSPLRTERLPALSPHFEQVMAPAGRDLTGDQARIIRYPHPRPAWTAENVSIEFYRHASPSIARIAIVPADDVDPTRAPPAPPPGELDRLTFHGFVFEGHSVDWNTPAVAAGEDLSRTPPQYTSTEQARNTLRLGRAFWCGPTEQLPRFLESWRRWGSHDAGEQTERSRNTLRVYGDESSEGILREWIARSSGENPTSVGTR